MKLSSTTIFLFLVIALAGVSVYSYFKNRAAPIIAPPSTVGTEKVERENENISIAVTYPVIPGDTKEVVAANEYIRQEIRSRIEGFEIEAKDTMSRDIGLPKEVKSSVTGSPAIEERNERYISMFMGMEWYLRGAAHPSHSIDTYVYDYEKGTLVDVSDMFKPGADYLKLLSQYSYQDLLMQSKEGDLGFVFDEEMVTEGTKPIKENFARVLPLQDGLMIYFNEYQVAPYAAGPQQVVIPYTKLTNIINPDGVLGMYIQ